MGKGGKRVYKRGGTASKSSGKNHFDGGFVESKTFKDNGIERYASNFIVCEF